MGWGMGLQLGGWLGEGSFAPRVLSELNRTISRYAGIPEAVVGEVFWTIFAVTAYILLRLVVSRSAGKWVQHAGRRYVLVKTITYLAGVVVIVAVLRIWHVDLSQTATYLGLVSAALVIALQTPVGNLAGWLSIVVQQPFVVGDRIQVGGNAGDVVDISLFNFTLLEIGKEDSGEQSTGRIVHVPNGIVFRETVCNSTQGFNYVWHEMPVGVTVNSDWQKAKEILTELANRMCADRVQDAATAIARAGQKYMLFYGYLTPIVWTSFKDKRVVLTVRYLCEVRQRRVSNSRMWEEILKEFSRHEDIQLA